MAILKCAAHSVWHTSGSGRVGHYGARLGRASVMRLWRVCVYDECELVTIKRDDVRSYTCTHPAISIALTLHTHCTLALCQTLFLYLYISLSCLIK